MSAGATTAAIAAAKELTAKGYVVTVERNSVRIYQKPGADGSLKPIRCAGCKHLQGMEHPTRGRVCYCRIGNWRTRKGFDVWYAPSKLFAPPPHLARISETCTDREPASAEVD